jgi:hypothetical protein
MQSSNRLLTKSDSVIRRSYSTIKEDKRPWEIIKRTQKKVRTVPA